MITERNIKFILMVVLYLSLFVYIFVTEVPLGFIELSTPSSSYIVLIKVSGFLVSSLTLVASVNSSYLTRKVLGDNYIAGDYEGKSTQISVDESVEDNHFEKFTIRQNLISTKISGISKDANDEYYATWNGNLVNCDNQHFKFLVELDTPNRELSGIIQLNFINNEVFGYATAIGSSSQTKWKFELVKLK